MTGMVGVRSILSSSPSSGPWHGPCACWQFATHKTLVHLYLATVVASQLRSHVRGLDDQPQAVKHEPCRLLRNPQVFRNLIGADTVFAVHQQPHRRKPLGKRNRRVLKNRPALHRKLDTAVPALPPFLGLDVVRLVGCALWAFRAVRPAHFGNRINASSDPACQRLRQAPGQAPWLRPRSSPQSATERPFIRAGSSPPGWDLCQNSTRPAARQGSSASASAATAICGSCLSMALDLPSSASSENDRRSVPGSTLLSAGLRSR